MNHGDLAVGAAASVAVVVALLAGQHQAAPAATNVASSDIPTDTTLTTATTLPAGTVLPGGASITDPSGVVVWSVPAGTTITTALPLPVGTVLSGGAVVPGGAATPPQGTTTAPSGVTSGSTSTSGTTPPTGTSCTPIGSLVCLAAPTATTPPAPVAQPQPVATTASPPTFQTGGTPNLPAYWPQLDATGKKLAMAFLLGTGRWRGYSTAGGVLSGQPNPPTVQSAEGTDIANFNAYGWNSVCHGWAYDPMGEFVAHVNAAIPVGAETSTPFDVLFVTAAYNVLLGRAPSASDLAYWVPVWDSNQQSSGSGSKAIDYELLVSQEFQTRVLNMVAAAGG